MSFKACVIGDSQQGGYGHAFDLAFTGYEEIDLVAVADPDQEGRERVGKSVGAKRLYADYREMLEKERPDLVAIGPRWPIHHKAYLLAATEVGAHGYLEKPICVDLAEADEMVSAIEAKNLKWAVGFQISREPGFLHAKQLILEGFIGDILEVRLRGKEDHRAGGEDLIVLGIHLFDATLSIFGHPLTCDAHVYTDGHPSRPNDIREPTEPLGPVLGNRVVANFTFGNGLPVSFQSFSQTKRVASRFGMDVYGSQGIVKIRWGFPPRIRYNTSASWLDLEGLGWKPLPGAPEDSAPATPESRNRRVVDDLLAAIREDRLPDVSLQRGRWALEMIQSVPASHVSGSRITFPLEQRVHPLKNWRG